MISKLFEKVILKRQEHIDVAKQINPLQYGFQKGKSCKMHVCYLDARAAFDNMWTTGLIHKLYNLGIKGKLFRIINNSIVLYNGYLSETFQIMQGTRQGSICAPFYIIHVNGLLDEL